MSKKLVCIDAGHSLVTEGKRTPKLLENIKDKDGKVIKKVGSCIHEYEFNKAVALKLGEILKENGMNVCYTGFKDKYDTPLKTRAKLANESGADIVVSCHFNAKGNCTEFQTTHKGLLVERTLNCSSKSIKLAECVCDTLSSEIKPERVYGVMRDIDMSGFTLAILRLTNAPAILIEYGFMDYWKECKKMLDEDFIEKCAIGTAKGICKYFGMTFKHEKESNLPRYVKVIADKVNVRNKPSWSDDAVEGELEEGTVLTVLEKVKVGSSYMYRTPYVYITANEKYVEPIY